MLMACGEVLVACRRLGPLNGMAVAAKTGIPPVVAVARSVALRYRAASSVTTGNSDVVCVYGDCRRGIRRHGSHKYDGEPNWHSHRSKRDFHELPPRLLLPEIELQPQS